jgi:phosphatidate cytidylyltransferase
LWRALARRTVISNPLADPLFGPTLGVLGGVLVLGLILVVLAARRSLGRLPSSVLFRRWCVWAAIAPLYALAVLSGSIPLLLLISVVVVQALREYSRLVGLPRAYEIVLLAAGLVMGPLAVWYPSAFFGILPLLLIAATLQPLLSQDVHGGMRRLAFAALGFAYLPLLLGHVLLIDAWLPQGSGVLLVLGLAIALSDVGAFTVGRLFGHHHLSPIVSPNKTWEGVVGNLLGAAIGTSLLGFALPAALPGWLLGALPLVVAVGCVWGDLIESLLKREFGTKDAGTWLPGFGGLMDRIDSLIVVAPLAYYLLRAFG